MSAKKKKSPALRQLAWRRFASLKDMFHGNQSKRKKRKCLRRCFVLLLLCFASRAASTRLLRKTSQQRPRCTYSSTELCGHFKRRVHMHHGVLLDPAPAATAPRAAVCRSAAAGVAPRHLLRIRRREDVGKFHGSSKMLDPWHLHFSFTDTHYARVAPHYFPPPPGAARDCGTARVLPTSQALRTGGPPCPAPPLTLLPAPRAGRAPHPPSSPQLDGWDARAAARAAGPAAAPAAAARRRPDGGRGRGSVERAARRAQGVRPPCAGTLMRPRLAAAAAGASWGGRGERVGRCILHVAGTGAC